ncbi:MAG: sigma-70 family RNA polymerase sigma factor [Acidobacteriota bacterium]|nr:sigma-70 family RNA polymerase sigma factor [Acidobacteriota bacterium]
MEKSDEELVAGCRQGDEEAWSLLAARYQRLLYAIPRRAGLDEDAAADILQQTFLKLLENLPKIQQPAQIHAWLVTTARRETLYFLRQRKKAPQVSLDAGEDDEFKEKEFSAAELLADEVLFEMERQHRVRTAVTNLDERCRNLITLLFYQQAQIPYSEIARILGISEGSIGPTRARCLQKLLERLNKPVVK